MIQTKNSLSDSFAKLIATTFFLILFFGHTLAYFNSPDVSSKIVLMVVDAIYMLKKLLLFVSVMCVFLRRRITPVALISVLTVIVIVLFTYLRSTEQAALFSDVYLDFFCGVAFFLLLVSGIVRLERLMPIAVWVGRILLIFCFLSVLQQSNWQYFVSRNYMFLSNAFLVPIAVLIYSIFQNGHWLDHLFVVLGVLVVLLYGSRGDFLALSVLMVILLYWKIKKKFVLYLLLLIPVLMIGVFIILDSGVLSGSDSRTIAKIFSGEFFQSQSRMEIWGYLLSRCASNAFIGLGLCTDRLYLVELQQTNKQVYAHNFFVEVLVDFGIIGLIASIAVIVILIKFIKQCCDDQIRNTIILFTCISLLVLMFSRSFLVEPTFFMMLGTILNWQLNKK